MTPASLLLTTLLLLPVSALAGKSGGSYAKGQAEFNRGNFAAALKHLDAASAEGNDDATNAKIHLLRGQAFAAQQQFDDAEGAFAKALQYDPEASLDPSRVDPKLVRMLDDLRDRTRTEVTVRASVPGSAVKIDGEYVGTSPVTKDVSIGRHKIEATSPDGKRSAKTEVVVRPNRALELPLTLEETREQRKERDDPPPPPPPGRSLQGFADLRGNWNPFPLIGSGGLEVGGGVERQVFRAGLHLRLFPEFGLAPRGALHVPITDQIEGLLELELPFIFTERGIVAGLGAAGGAEFMLTKWIGAFAQIGFRYNFLTAEGRVDNSQLYLQGGVRLRLPK